MGAPTGLELFCASQEIIFRRTFRDAFPDGHAPQHHPNAANSRWATLMIDCFLQRVKNPIESETELRGPDRSIHFQMIETKPAAAQKIVRDLVVERAFLRAME